MFSSISILASAVALLSVLPSGAIAKMSCEQAKELVGCTNVNYILPFKIVSNTLNDTKNSYMSYIRPVDTYKAANGNLQLYTADANAENTTMPVVGLNTLQFGFYHSKYPVPGEPFTFLTDDHDSDKAGNIGLVNAEANEGVDGGNTTVLGCAITVGRGSASRKFFSCPDSEGREVIYWHLPSGPEADKCKHTQLFAVPNRGD